LYLSIGTKQDIAFPVGNVARYSSNPTKQHWTALKRSLRDVKGTRNLVIEILIRLAVALSTAEAEYIALSTATQEAMWLRKLLMELRNAPEEATAMHEDNQSAIAMAQSTQYQGRA